MSSPLKEEVRRFKRLFVNYTKVILGGMLLSSIFLFLYTGIRANYISIVVLTAVVSTISLSLVMLLLYVRFHERRWKTQLDGSTSEALTKTHKAENEELRKLIVDAIVGRPSTQTETFSMRKLTVAEHVLVSVFQWGHLIGKMFYYGLTTVRMESGFDKGPKEI